MKQSPLKKVFAVLLLLLISSTAFLPASANSALTYWRGIDAMGATVMEEICPVEVERELLTFDLAELYQTSYETKEEFLAYSGRVSAEYTFYNPADYTVTAKLFFPFGPVGFQSGYNEDGEITSADVNKYGITVNGEEIEKRVRHTVQTTTQLAILEQIPRLHDAYMTDDFYTPTTTVTKYTYTVDIDFTKRRHAIIAFTWNGGDGSTRLCVWNSIGKRLPETGEVDFEVGLASTGNKQFEIYAIGAPLDTFPQMKCFSDVDGKRGEEIEGTVTLVKRERMRLETLLLQQWNKETGVSKVDWYNGMLTLLQKDITGAKDKYFSTSGKSALNLSTEGFLRNLTQWYEYDITVPARSRIVNKVTAPIYPTINAKYTPRIYEYTYLLSPAGTWARFGELEVVINTPYYMIENTLEGFEKTPNGYVLRRTGLPDGELVFTLCTSQNPKLPKKTFFDYVPREPFLFFSSIIGSAAIIAGIVIFVVRKRKKAKEKKE